MACSGSGGFKKCQILIFRVIAFQWTVLSTDNLSCDETLGAVLQRCLCCLYNITIHLPITCYMGQVLIYTRWYVWLRMCFAKPVPLLIFQFSCNHLLLRLWLLPYNRYPPVTGIHCSCLHASMVLPKKLYIF